MLKAGDIILTKIQFTDTFEVKTRPALVVIVAGITSNKSMKGVPITTKEGAVKDSVIKLNYIFTISKIMIEKTLFSLSKEKKKQVFEELINKLKGLA
jgi:mRNA interferase MazF